MRRRGAQGFTLIELITVIIVLGILAAIVVPRYYDMADQAAEGANDHALSDAIVQFNLAYMKFVVENKVPPANLAAISGSNYLDLDGNDRVEVGDYRFTYAANGDNVDISAERSDGSGGWDTAVTRTIEWP